MNIILKKAICWALICCFIPLHAQTLSAPPGFTLSNPNQPTQQTQQPLTVGTVNNYGAWGQAGPSSTYCGGVNQDPCRPAPAKFESTAMMYCPAGTFPGQGECFTCPTGYTRSVWPAAGPRGCRKDDASVAAVDLPAVYAGDPIKLLKCEPGEFYDAGKGGSCWSCPPDTRRSTFPVTGPRACQAPAGVAYAKAVPSGSNRMCQAGQIHDLAGSGTENVRNRLRVQFGGSIPASVAQTLGQGFGSCWTCPPGRKRTYAAVWSDSACVAETIDFKPGGYNHPGMFRLDGAEDVVVALMRERSVINLYAAVMNAPDNPDVTAAVIETWDEIAASPATSVVLQAALWDRVANALTNPQTATPAERRLAAGFAEAIRRYRLYQAQSALDAYDLWYAADAYQKLRSEERIGAPATAADLAQVGFKPPDFSQISGAVIALDFATLAVSYTAVELALNPRALNLTKHITPYLRRTADGLADGLQRVAQTTYRDGKTLSAAAQQIDAAAKVVARTTSRLEDPIQLLARKFGLEAAEQIQKRAAEKVAEMAARKAALTAVGKAGNAALSILKILGSSGPQIIISVLVEVAQLITEAFISAQMERPNLVRDVARAGIPVDAARMMLNLTGESELVHQWAMALAVEGAPRPGRIAEMASLANAAKAEMASGATTTAAAPAAAPASAPRAPASAASAPRPAGSSAAGSTTAPAAAAPAAATPAAATSPAAAPAGNPGFMIAAQAGPNLCVGIVTRPNGQQALLGPCAGADARRWYGVADQLQAAGTNTCLTVSGNGSLSLATCQGLPAQKWTLTPQGDVRSGTTACMGATTPTAGAPISGVGCNGQPTQKWKVLQ